MRKVLGNIEKGLLFVVSAPAGTGKTTLVHMLTKEYSAVVQSISCTTRSPRNNEKNGVHYHFIDKEGFEEKIKEGEFLEYAKIYDDYYGTSKKWVEEQRTLGKHVILVIDIQGAQQLKNKADAIYIFIEPPSFEVLQQRLIGRKTENPETVKQRLSWAKQEMQAGKSYDYRIVNEDLEISYQVLKSIIIASEHRKQS